MKHACTAILVSALAANGLVGCQSGPPEKSPAPARAIAATAHPVATEVAQNVLRQGGNAADAAIAAGFALAVVEPAMSHLGGRIQILYRSPDGQYHGYDGMTEVPASFVVPEEPVSQGYGTIATPGVVAGLGRLHAEHGTLPWAVLLDEPAAIARNGFELLPGGAERHASGFETFHDNPGFLEVFVEPDGTAYDAGDLLRQPVLARTIEQLAANGAADFYQGRIARQIAADMAANGGYVSARDLAAYRVLDGRYISTRYRGYEIHSLAAPAGGGLVVRTLNILENFNLASMTEPQWAAVVNQALALAINGMAEDRAELDLERVADKDWAARQATAIRVPEPAVALLSTSLQVGEAGPTVTDWTGREWGNDSHHTTHFTIVDCDGGVVSITQTVGPLFGSRVITPGLGFVYAATMGSYLSSAEQLPGTRPRTTIAPTIVTKDGEVVLALGAAGGMRILSAIVQTISRYVDQGHDPETSVALPRVHPERIRTDEGDRLTLGERINMEMTPQRGWPAAVADVLAASGFDVIPVEEHAAFGRVHLVAHADDRWTGVADPDWEGDVGGVSCAAR